MPDLQIESEPRRKPSELQNPFLNSLRGKSMTVYLINGIRLTGTLQAFDPFCLLLENSDGGQQLVFKHAIATVVPGISGSVRKERQARAPVGEKTADA